MTSEAVIFHYWRDRNDDLPRYQDMANPVVVSIATLRAHHPDLPVYVVDISDRPGFWGHFPEKLKFEVIYQEPAIPLRHIPELKMIRNSWKYCSSTFDVTGQADKIPEDQIIFCDSDIFFLSPLLPLPFDDRLHINPEYVGHYFYDNNSKKVRDLIELWKRTILSGIADLTLRKEITASYRIPGFMNQESALLWLSRTRDLSDVVAPLSVQEHCFELDFIGPLKFFHWTSYHFGERRGLAAYATKEYYEPLLKLLGEEDMKLIFQTDISGGVVKFANRSRIAGNRLDLGLIKRFGRPHRF